MKRHYAGGSYLTVGGKLLLSPLKKELTRLKLRKRGSFGGSTWFSLAIRPVLEKDRVKALFMAPLFVAAVGVGINEMPDTTGVSDAWESEQPIKTVMEYEVKMPQEGDKITYLIPVEQLTGISQGFHQGHFGIDLRAPLNSPVIAMERGTVQAVERDTFGYGKHIYIKHLYEVTSLYAHLNVIKVQPGQEVHSGQIIGLVGTTGWSTGPHVHFEIYEGENRVNPMKYIGESLKMLKEQATN